MSCSLALSIALLTSMPVEAQQSIDVATVSAPVDVDTLMMQLVEQSRNLKGIVDNWVAQGEAENASLALGSAFADFKTRIATLEQLNMAAHVELRARDADGDLPCIFRGIAEDLPKRIQNIETAHDSTERKLALEEMAYLLNDNSEVILAGPIAP